jgi:hypothetical protein
MKIYSLHMAKWQHSSDYAVNCQTSKNTLGL